jgi:hypothetical protein
MKNINFISIISVLSLILSLLSFSTFFFVTPVSKHRGKGQENISSQEESRWSPNKILDLGIDGDNVKLHLEEMLCVDVYSGCDRVTDRTVHASDSSVGKNISFSLRL